MEILCPTCRTWSHFIQDKLKILIYLSLDKCKICYKVNKILYFIFRLIIMSSHVALETVWILVQLASSVYKRVDICKSSKHRKELANLYYRTSKIFFGQVHYGHLLVPG